MYRLTDQDLRDRIYPVLMRYTPDALKRLPKDRLVAEIVAELQGLEIIGFRRPGLAHTAGDTNDGVRAAHARARLNAEALERVAREAVTAILAVVEVRQR